MANPSADDTIKIDIDWKPFNKTINDFQSKLDQMMRDLASSTSGLGLKNLKEYEASKTRLLQIDNKFKQERRQLEVATRMSGVGGGVFGNISNIAQSYAYARRGDTDRLRTLSGQQTLTADEMKERDLLVKRGAGKSPFDKLFDKFDTLFGAGSKWDETFKGHGKAVAGGLGVLGMAGGAQLGKMIIDSSPAFQQLLKIMNYGIMLVLRPIGDFFAFLFRPILILLLRKFIIPFYQHVYPWFVKNGKAIGNAIEKIASGEWAVDIGKTIAESLKVKAATTKPKELPPKQKTPPALEDKTKIIGRPEKQKALPEPIESKLFREASAELDPMFKPQVMSTLNPQSGKGHIDKIGSLAKATKALESTSKLGKYGSMLKAAGTAGKVLNKASGLPAEIALKSGRVAFNTAKKLTPSPIKSVVGKTTAPATKALQKTATKIAATTGGKLAMKAIPIAGQVLTAIDAAGSILKAVNPDAYNQIREGARSIFEPVIGHEGFEFGSDILGWGEKSTAEQMVDLGKGVGDFFTPHAAGGMIREPIRGLGMRSGKRYMFGEGGNELVVPTNKIPKTSPTDSSAPVVINITVNGSIMSDRDMLNFQRTIMRAVESSNTRRAKL